MNAVVHYKSSDGLTTKEHDTTMERIETMIMDVDPTDLLPEYRNLLHVDYEKLGDGTAEEKQIWLAEMDSVVSAANHIIRGPWQALQSRYNTGPQVATQSTTEKTNEPINSEGIIRWR